MRSVPLLSAALLAASIAGQAQADAVFSGRLAAAPCRANQDILVVNGEVRPGESVDCRTSRNHSIHITETTIPAGASFGAAVGGQPAAWAKTECDPSEGVYSDSDCNRCVNDVFEQFIALFDDFEEDVLTWDYRENGIYRPSGDKPQAFTNSNANSHVQGFVRTNSKVFPFAGTYSRASESNLGFMFVIEDEDQDLELEMLHRAWHNHPSGAAILGRRMWFGDKRSGIDGYVIRSIDVSWPGATEQGFFELPNVFEGRRPTVGGGLGLTALSGGGYLLVAMGPGGNKAANPTVDFFYVVGKHNASTGALGSIATVGNDNRFAVEVEPLSRWSLNDVDPNHENEATTGEFKHSENLSVLTECRSGDVYVVNSTGPGSPQLFGEGKHRLSRVVWDTLDAHNLPAGISAGMMGPELRPIAWGKHPQNPHRCHPRSAATFWANEAHELELYCSEFEAVDGETRMHFTRRRPK